jgi:hypothetical protein
MLLGKIFAIRKQLTIAMEELKKANSTTAYSNRRCFLCGPRRGKAKATRCVESQLLFGHGIYNVRSHVILRTLVFVWLIIMLLGV